MCSFRVFNLLNKLKAHEQLCAPIYQMEIYKLEYKPIFIVKFIPYLINILCKKADHRISKYSRQ